MSVVEQHIGENAFRSLLEEAIANREVGYPKFAEAVARLVRGAFKMISDSATKQDLTQEVQLIVAKDLPKLRQIPLPLHWTCGVARNVRKRFLSGAVKERALRSDRDLAKPVVVDSDSARSNFLELMDQFLSELPREEADVIRALLAADPPPTYKKAAELLGKTVDQVSYRVENARVAYRQWRIRNDKNV